VSCVGCVWCVSESYVSGTIRFKISSALRAWDPSDGSAYALISPWSSVFTAKDMESLLVRSILPKLTACVRTCTITPNTQRADELDWLFAWLPMLSLEHVVSVLEREFFPRWGQVMYTWLSDTHRRAHTRTHTVTDTLAHTRAHNSDYESVTTWYLSWKGSFPSTVSDHERIRSNFDQALSMMDAVLDDKPIPPPSLRAHIPPHTPLPSSYQPPPPPRPSRAPTHPLDEVSVKEALERLAASHNVLLMPTNKQTSDGYAHAPTVSYTLILTLSYARACDHERTLAHLLTPTQETYMVIR